MTRTTEHCLEGFAIKLLEHLSYEQSVHHTLLRMAKILSGVLTKKHYSAIAGQRPSEESTQLTVLAATQEEAIREIQRIH